MEHAKRNIEIEYPNIHKMKMSLFVCVLMMCLLSCFAAVFATWIFSNHGFVDLLMNFAYITFYGNLINKPYRGQGLKIKGNKLL